MNFRNMGSSSEAAMPLARQLSSVYSLTLDEFQTTIGGIGRDFGSMNMDEFLKNIWTAEESQTIAGATSGGLQRQGSLTLPRTLSLKTVDEVWRDVAAGDQQQTTLGEMTLEEFLVRAGVVREEQQPVSNNSSSTAINLSFAQPAWNNGAAPYPVPMPLGNAADLTSPRGMRGSALNSGVMVGMGGGGMAVGAATESPVNQTSSDGRGNGDLSSISPAPYAFGGGLKVRKCSGVVEKVVERRQRRMIKNRESAARSRARKQAYTMELEAEVAKLKEQNEKLQKKQMEINEMQKSQVLEMMNHQHVAKKRCLRRTQTGPW